MLTLEEGAHRVIRTCVQVSPDERVLILYDLRSNVAPAWALRRAASTLGGNAHVRYLDDSDPSGRADKFAQIIDELADLDVIVALTSSSVLTSPAAHLAAAAGGRLFTMTGADERTLTRGAVEADFSALAPVGEYLAARITDASEAEVQSPGGTRLGMSVHGRCGVPNPPAEPRAGVFRVPYAGVLFAPVEESVEGVIVVDGSTSCGLVDSPVTITVERGRAVRVDGKSAAKDIEHLLDQGSDADHDLVGLIGFGLNPAAKLQGTIGQDVTVAGTGHLSLGPNRGIGGANRGRRYTEFVYTQPTLVLNGVKVIKTGKPVSSLTLA